MGAILRFKRETGREALYKDEWERMHLLACITIQPHVKNRLKPERLLPLPWDTRPAALTKKKPAAPPVSDEEALRRFELTMKKVENYEARR